MPKIKAISVVGGNKDKILAKTCRTCASFFGLESDLVSIFTELICNDRFAILELLNFLKLEIKEDDGLPQKICNQCVTQLLNIQAFREQSQNSQIELRNHFNVPLTGNETCIAIKKEENFDYGNDNYDSSFDFVDILHEPKQDLDEPFLDQSFHFDDDDDDDKNPFNCWYCDATFKNERELKIHEMHHTEYSCEFCSQTVKTPRDLKHHIRKNHKYGLKIPCTSCQCEYCGIVFPEPIHLKRHIKIHMGGYAPRDTSSCQGNYVCPICSKAFIIPSGLEKHLKLHDKSRKYRCEECNLGYTRSEHLQRHMNQAHLQGKIYKCKECNRAFVDAGDMRRHAKLHEEQEYKCKYCGKSIYNLKYLAAHERIHTGEKPCVCTICGKGFRYNRLLMYHQRQHTAEEHEAIRKKILCNSGSTIQQQLNLTYEEYSVEMQQVSDIVEVVGE